LTAVDVAGVHREIDAVDGSHAAVALDQPTRLDRDCLAHSASVAALPSPPATMVIGAS